MRFGVVLQVTNPILPELPGKYFPPKQLLLVQTL